MIVKALASLPPAERADFVVIGSREALERADRVCGTGLSFGDADALGGAVRVDEVEIAGPLPAIGKVDPVAGDASVRYNARAVDLATRGAADVIVTAPINRKR